MAISRYEIRKMVTNDVSLYSEHFKKRDVKFINQYTTPEFAKNALEKMKDVVYSYHIWKRGDRLFKLSYEHYGEASLWWVIALVNQKPTDSHFSVGDLVMIPKPLNKILEAFNI